MKATIRDATNALTLRNCLIFAGLMLVSYFLIDLVGYLVWRRFPIPILIIFVAVLGWKIGRKIGHAGLSKLLHAASVGLGGFGIAVFVAAIIDGNYFALMGYVSWAVMMTLWGWIAFQTWRAWSVLKDMPPDKLQHVTEGTETIYAQMTYRQARIKKTLADYEEAKKHLFAAA